MFSLRWGVVRVVRLIGAKEVMFFSPPGFINSELVRGMPERERGPGAAVGTTL